MKIQKIFSEIETGEKFYSVLMSEEELTLFSKIGEFVDTVKKARKYDKTPTKVIYQVLYFYLSFSLSILIASFTPF